MLGQQLPVTREELVLRLVDVAFLLATYRIYKLFHSLQVPLKEDLCCTNSSDDAVPQLDDSDCSMVSDETSEDSNSCPVCFQQGAYQSCSCEACRHGFYHYCTRTSRVRVVDDDSASSTSSNNTKSSSCPCCRTTLSKNDANTTSTDLGVPQTIIDFMECMAST